jgi:hypothetical protein
MDVTELKLWLLMLVVNSPVYVLWGWVLFRSWASFWEAVVFLFKPELWSMIEGRYWDDIYAEAKLAIWFFLPIGLIRLEVWLLLGK